MATLESADLNLLVPLRALLRHRSVTRAAADCGVSQPTMSNTLRRLRHLLDDELLVRAGRGYELTTRAQTLLEPLEAALRAIDNQVIKAPAFVPGESRREFTVACTGGAAATVLAELAKRFAERTPTVSLRLVPLRGDPDSLLGDSGVDLVLIPDSNRTRLPRERLYEERFVWVVDAGNSAVGSSLSRDDVERFPHVAVEANGVPTIPEQLLRAELPGRRVQATASDFLLVPFLLHGTSMISVLQLRLARRLADLGMVRIVGGPVPIPLAGVSMVWNPRRVTDVACAWLREELRQVIAEEPPQLAA